MIDSRPLVLVRFLQPPSTMAGHSKWANIQHRKNRQDAKRGQLWTKLIREITVAARDGGADAGMNPRLRLALEKASAQLGRKVAPTIYSPKELSKRVKQENAFVTRVLAQPKLWLIGDEGDLAA